MLLSPQAPLVEKQIEMLYIYEQEFVSRCKAKFSPLFKGFLWVHVSWYFVKI